MRIALAATLLVVLVLLWIFPGVVFPHPGINDAIRLSGAELPVLLLGLGFVIFGAVRWRGPSAAAAGVFLIASAVAVWIGLATFGNLSNDRFLPLLVLPIPIGAAGLVALVLGVTSSGDSRSEVVRAGTIGLCAAIVAGLWIEVRGAKDWLQAPYGFDITLLVIVVAAGLLVLVRGRSVPG